MLMPVVTRASVFKVSSERPTIFTEYSAKHKAKEQFLPNLHVDDFENNSVFTDKRP